MDDDALGPQRRTRHSFLLNSEMIDMVHNLFCWAPVELAVLKPEKQQYPQLVRYSLLQETGWKGQISLMFLLLKIQNCALSSLRLKALL